MSISNILLFMPDEQLQVWEQFTFWLFLKKNNSIFQKTFLKKKFEKKFVHLFFWNNTEKIKVKKVKKKFSTFCSHDISFLAKINETIWSCLYNFNKPQ